MSATILTDENDSDTYKVNRALQYVYIIHCESNTYLTPVFKNDFLQFNVERFTTTQFFTQKYDKSANEYSKAKETTCLNYDLVWSVDLDPGTETIALTHCKSGTVFNIDKESKSLPLHVPILDPKIFDSKDSLDTSDSFLREIRDDHKED